jgi:hypothetical protein
MRSARSGLLKTPVSLADKPPAKPMMTASTKNAQGPTEQGYFDLWNYADVKANANDILTRLSDKSMPTDASRPWPDEWIALFKRWVDEGCAV